MVFLKEFFEKVDFEKKKSADNWKNMKDLPGDKDFVTYHTSNQQKLRWDGTSVQSFFHTHCM